MRIGIDFGTTNSAAALYDGNRLHPITTLDHANILPSLIYLTRQHQVILGVEAAREYTRRETGRAVHWKTKDFGSIEIVVAGTGGGPIIYQHPITLTYDDAANGRLIQSVKTALRSIEYGGTQVFDRYYTLDELIALVLGYLKTQAETQLGQPCDEVVIGRPVQFSDRVYVSTRAEEIIYKAALRVGFREVRFQLEPIGALYLYHSEATQRQKALVFDFGGGTLDLTVAEVGGRSDPQVLATRGLLVGGDDLDKRIMRSLLPYFGEDPMNGMSLPYDLVNALGDWQTMPDLSRPQYRDTFTHLRKTHPRPDQIAALETLVTKNVGFSLFRAIERVKRDLTTQDESELHFLYESIQIQERITRAKFERWIAPELEAVREGVFAVLAEANTPPDQIEVVLRTGGSSLVPAFVRLLSEIFAPDKLTELDPLISVVGGLGILAYQERGLAGPYRHKYLDPIQDASYPRYTIGIDSRVYQDRETVIRKLPVELSGFQALQMRYNDREAQDETHLTFTIDRPCRVYVTYAASANTIPLWLRPFSLDANFKVEVHDEWWGIKELNIYSQEYPRGAVILGGNRAYGAHGKCDPQYLVIVEPL
ncbi:MAG: Hsp70 family protein [Anaerolineae bacterium]|jgi:hypothetical chaperone protein|nr:Hsp70 family protein [Anaerolineae bacterium]